MPDAGEGRRECSKVPVPFIVVFIDSRVAAFKVEGRGGEG